MSKEIDNVIKAAKSWKRAWDKGLVTQFKEEDVMPADERLVKAVDRLIAAERSKPRKESK